MLPTLPSSAASVAASVEVGAVAHLEPVDAHQRRHVLHLVHRLQDHRARGRPHRLDCAHVLDRGEVPQLEASHAVRIATPPDRLRTKWSPHGTHVHSEPSLSLSPQSLLCLFICFWFSYVGLLKTIGENLVHLRVALLALPAHLPHSPSPITPAPYPSPISGHPRAFSNIRISTFSL